MRALTSEPGMAEAIAQQGGLTTETIGKGYHVIQLRNREYGCPTCRELGTPGFIVKPYEFGLSEARHCARILNDSTFCTCPTAISLKTTCMKRVNVDEGTIAREQQVGMMKAEIERCFRGWHFPEDLDGYTVKSWSSKFGEDPTKIQARDAAVMLGKDGKIKTGTGRWSGLLLHGNSGVGKTGLVVGLLKYWQEKGHPVLLLTMNDILMMTNWQDDKQMERKRIELLSRVPYLGIDEMGMPGQNITDHERTRIIFPIIDARYKAGLPTLVTSNWQLSELKERLGEACYQRLLTLCAPVEVGGESGRDIVESAFGGTA